MNYEVVDNKDYRIFLTSTGKMSRKLGCFEKFFFCQDDVGSTHTVLLLNSEVKLDQRHLKEALLMLLERFPLLRMRVTDRFNKLWFEEMENPQCLDFRVEDVGAENWQGEFQRQINGPRFNTERGPLWRVTLLKETSDTKGGLEILYRNTLLFSFHHIICDGSSIYELKKKLLEFLGLLYNGEPIEVQSLPFRPPIECLMFRLITLDIRERLLTVANFMLRKLRVIFCNPLPSNLYLSTFPPPDNLVPEKTWVITRKLTREKTLAVIRCSKVNKCTVHGAIAAAAHFAMSQLLNQSSADLKYPLLIHSTYPVNIRKECQQKIQSEEFGLYASFNYNEMVMSSTRLDADGGAFWDFARSCTSKVRRSIESGAHRNFPKLFQCVNIPAYFALLVHENALGLHKALFNLNNLGSLHIGQERNSTYKFAGSNLATQSAKIGFVIGNNILTINDCLYWTVEFCPEVTTSGKAEEFCDLSIGILRNACS